MVRVNLIPGVRPGGAKPGIQLSRMAVLSIIAVSLVFLSIPMSLSLQVKRAQENNMALAQQLTQLNSLVSTIQPLKAQYQETVGQLEWFYSLASTGVDIGSFLKELRVTTPGDVWVSSLDFTADGMVSISGYSMDFDGISQFMSQLKLSPLCAAVELVSSKLTAMGTSDVVSFQMQYRMKKA